MKVGLYVSLATLLDKSFTFLFVLFVKMRSNNITEEFEVFTLSIIIASALSSFFNTEFSTNYYKNSEHGRNLNALTLLLVWLLVLIFCSGYGWKTGIKYSLIPIVITLNLFVSTKLRFEGRDLRYLILIAGRLLILIALILLNIDLYLSFILSGLISFIEVKFILRLNQLKFFKSSLIYYGFATALFGNIERYYILQLSIEESIKSDLFVLFTIIGYAGLLLDVHKRYYQKWFFKLFTQKVMKKETMRYFTFGLFIVAIAFIIIPIVFNLIGILSGNYNYDWTLVLIIGLPSLILIPYHYINLLYFVNDNTWPIICIQMTLIALMFVVNLNSVINFVLLKVFMSTALVLILFYISRSKFVNYYKIYLDEGNV